jgi:hypothetical protein
MIIIYLSRSQEIKVQSKIAMGKRNKHKSVIKANDNVNKKDGQRPKIMFQKSKELNDLVANLFNGRFT